MITNGLTTGTSTRWRWIAMFILPLTVFSAQIWASEESAEHRAERTAGVLDAFGERNPAVNTKTAVGETEANDTNSTADLLGSGDSGTGDITPAGDVDYWVRKDPSIGDLIFAFVDTSGSSASEDSVLQILANPLVAETEANDSFGTADTLVAGSSGAGDITPMEDNDFWVRGDTSIGHLVFAYVDTSHSSAGDDSELILFANDESQFATDDNDGPGASSCLAGAVVPQAGDVYFQVREYGSNNEISPYEIFQDVIDPARAAAEVEGNDSFATATPVNAPLMTGNVTGTDVDFFSFRASVGDRIAIILDGNSDPDLDILDVDGATLLASGGSNSSSNSTNCAGGVEAASTGTHYVRVSEGSTGGGDTAYQFVVLVTPASPLIEVDDNDGPGLSSCAAGGVVPYSGDIYFQVHEVSGTQTLTPYELIQDIIPPAETATEVEGNDTFGTATPVNGLIMTGSASGADVDFFSFSASAGDRIAVIMDDDPDGDFGLLDTELEILDIDGSTVLASGDNIGGNDSNCAGVVTVASTGTHYIRVSEGDAGAGDTDYRFVVIVNEAPVPVELMRFCVE